jgi:hypothetical protein
VYQQEVQSLVEAVHDILDEYPPLEPLRVWFLRLANFVQVKHGLGEALQTAAAQAVVNKTEAPVTEAIGVLLQACWRSMTLKWAAAAISTISCATRS